MQKIKTYACDVDSHRRPSRRRNTYGMYYVGAKTADEAKEILRKAIGFGSIHIAFVTEERKCKHKECVKRIVEHKNDKTTINFVPAIHATAPQKGKI